MDDLMVTTSRRRTVVDNGRTSKGKKRMRSLLGEERETDRQTERERQRQRKRQRQTGRQTESWGKKETGRQSEGGIDGMMR